MPKEKQMDFDSNKPFDEQYPIIKKTLLGYLIKNFGNSLHRETLEDVTDSAIAKAFAEHKFNEKRGNLFTFLITVAKNEIKSHFRSSQHRKEISLDGDEDQNQDSNPFLATDRGNPETPYLKKYFFNRYYKALTKLTMEERKILVMTHGMSLTDKRISELTGKKSGAIQKMRCVALQKLSKTLSESIELTALPEQLDYKLSQDEIVLFSGLTDDREIEILRDLLFHDLSDAEVCRKNKVTKSKAKEVITSAITSIAAASVKRKKPGKKDPERLFSGLISSMITFGFR